MMNSQWKTISVILVVVGAGIVFFGLRYFSDNPPDTRQTETHEIRDTRSRKVIKLERPAAQAEPSEENGAAPSPEATRITRIFGEMPPGFLMDERSECQELEQKVRSFFAYLDETDAMESADQEDATSAYDTFQKMMADLSENMPTVVGETRDMISLMHNQAHFSRTLNKERIELINKIFTTEQDIIEPAMAVFYGYYGCNDCCEGGAREPISLEVLYTYAGFFLDTLSGKSYLMRRSSAIRGLTLYYSVMVIDQANKAGMNRFGLDVRPYIDVAMDDISNRTNLLYKDHYVDNLTALKEKYREGAELAAE